MSGTAHLDVVIRAKDEATQVLRSLNQELAGVGTKGQQTATQLGAVDKALGNAKTAALGFGAGMATALVTDKLVAFGRASVNAASDLNESMTASQDVFESHGREMEAWADQAAESFGQSQRQALEASTNFGLLFTTMGLGEDAAAGMSRRMVELASDMASFKNIGVDEALTKLQAGLVGEIEPLRTVGVLLSAAAVEAKAMELGLADATGELSEAAKVQARYALILEQTATMHGNYAETADDLANQQRTLDAQFENMQATIGQGLLPAMVELTSAANDLMASPLFQAGLEGYSGQIEEMAGALGTMTDMARSAAEPLGMVNDRLDLMTGFGGALDAMVKSALPGYGALSAVADGIGLIQDRLQESEPPLDGFVEWMDKAVVKAQLMGDAFRHNDIDLFIQRVIELSGGLLTEKDATEELIIAVDRATEVERNRADAIERSKVVTIAEAEAAMSRRRALEDAVEGSVRATVEGHRHTQMLAESIVEYDLVAHAAARVGAAQEALASTYQLAAFNAGIFNAQGSEYSAIAGDMTKAYDILKERQENNIQLTDEQTHFLDSYHENLGRVEGGMEDAAIQAGLYRTAQADLMQAQDELNAATRDGVKDLAPYEQAVADAEQSLKDAGEASGGMRDSNDLLFELLSTQLTPAIEGLRDLLIEISGIDPQIDITANADAVKNAIEEMRSYAANNPINVPIYGTVAGGNDMVTYAVGGAGGSAGTAGMGDQAAFRDKAFQSGEIIGENFGRGFTTGVETVIGGNGGAPSLITGGAPIGDVGRTDGTEYGEGFGDGFEGWLTANWGSLQNAFTSEGGLAGIMTGESQANLQADIKRMEVYLGALMEAGFGPGSPMYDEAYTQYQQFLLDLEAMNIIAGTEAAEAYWNEYLNSLPKQEIGVAFWDAGDHAGREFGRAWVDGVLTEDWWGLGRDIGEDMTEGAVFALDSFDWSGTGYSAGQEFAEGAVTGIAEGFAKNPDTTFGKAPGSATDSPPPGMIASGGAGGSAMFWQGGFSIPEDIYGAGPYDSAFLYEQSVRQNPNRRRGGGGGSMQPIHIHLTNQIDGDVIDRRTEKVLARLAMEAI